jgi:hypothetical protein
MAIQLIGRSNSGGASETWKVDTNEAVRTATETYLIQGDPCTAGDYDTETEIAQALDGLGVPNLADESTDNPQMYCVGRTIRLMPGSEDIWEIVCTFDNNPRRGMNAGGDGGGGGSASWGGGGVPLSPFLELAQVSMSVDEVEIQTIQDKAEKPVATTAGEVLDGFTHRLPVAVFNVEQIEQFVSISSIMGKIGKVHVGGSFISGFGDYEILFSDFSARPTSVDGVNGYQCKYQFRCLSRGVVGTNTKKSDGSTPTGTQIGWRAIIPNYGTFEKPGVGETEFETTAQRLLGRPRWWLNASGDFESPSSLPALPTYILIDNYETTNLVTGLNLRLT